MKTLWISILMLCLSTLAFCQNEMKKEMSDLPYFNIPDAPEEFTGGHILQRSLDGLGYRYYWATENLNEADLAYKPSEDSRTILETMEHILALSRTCLNVSQNLPNERNRDEEFPGYEEMRKQTLENIKKASEIFATKSMEELEALHVIFKRADRTSEFPLWNLINGQLADAMYHTGQIAAYRRAAGNPVSPRSNVFTGKTKELN